TPFSVPAMSDAYTAVGRRFFARRCASATDSNGALVNSTWTHSSSDSFGRERPATPGAGLRRAAQRLGPPSNRGEERTNPKGAAPRHGGAPAACRRGRVEYSGHGDPTTQC